MNATHNTQNEQMKVFCSFLDDVIKPQLDYVRDTLPKRDPEDDFIVAKRGKSFNIGNLVFYFNCEVCRGDYYAYVTLQGDPNHESHEVSTSFLKCLGVM